MSDLIDKIIPWIVFPLAGAVLVAAIFATIKLGEKSEDCVNRGGMMTKTTNGWRCLEVKELK
jgi:hypothetical protein